MTAPPLLQLGALPVWDQEPLDAAFAVRRYFAAPDRQALLAEAGPGIRAIVTHGGIAVPAALIDACPALEIVAVYGVGYDAVDLDACRARGIRVTNTPGVLTGDCADLAVGMMICLARGMIGAERFVREGGWAAGPYPLQRRAWGRRAGILGLGAIGRAVAVRLEGFGMDIAYAARGPKDVPADWAFVPDPVALAGRSDVLFVTLAASAATRHIVSRAVLAALGPQGTLINISRAANVDEAALIEALETGGIAAAALDVFEGEPHLDPRLLALPNVLLQPHVASATVETRRAMGQLMRDNLAAHFAGQPLPTPVI